MADAKPSCCPKCGAAATFVSCPACGGVIWWDLAGWTAGLSVVIAACVLVATYAASWWMKAGAAAVALGCAVGLFGLRASLLRAVRMTVPDFPWHEGREPWPVILWNSSAIGLLLTAIMAGFVGYDWVDTRPAPTTTAAAAPTAAPPSPAPKPNPLPVAVTFRPAATGTVGQSVFLTGAPGGKPLTVRVTTTPPTEPGLNPAIALAGRKHTRTALALWLINEEAKKKAELERRYSADVPVPPGVEVLVNWNGGHGILVAPGRSITLTCPGYDPLTTSVSVPLKGHVPPPNVLPTYPPPAEYRPPFPARPLGPGAGSDHWSPIGVSADRPHLARPPLRFPLVDPEKQKRAREALAEQLTTSFRDSVVGKGKVLVLTNAGPVATPPIRVRVLRPSRIVQGTNDVVAEYTLASGVDAGRKAEVGWLELDKELQSGDWVELLVGGDVVKSARVD